MPAAMKCARHGSDMGTHESGITVGMPVCNGMPWLPEAMESLLRQTTTAFEILVIVDGGSDESAQYLKNLEDARLRRGLDEPRLRVLRQPNQGVTATLNRLLAEVRTPWLARMDADDVSYPKRVRKLREAIAAHPDAGFIYSLADYHPRELCAGQFRCSRGTPDELRAIVERGYLLSICHSTVALNVNKVRAAGGYRMDIHAEDSDLWWRMALRYDVECISEVLVGFRLNPQSVSTKNLEKQQLGAIYVQYLLLSELLRLHPRPLGEVASVLLKFLRPTAIAAKESLRHGNMLLGQGQRMKGIAALAEAVLLSPSYVARRVLDEVRHVAIANGVEPRRFLECREVLWA
jgi:hypothetical protein